jgi:tetratricopeptide (TPR) repeat protein
MTTATLTDRYGYALSTASAEAVEQYIDGIDRNLSGNARASEAMRAAVAADEGFALGHVALARLLQFEGKMAESRAHLERAQALAGGITRREQQHIAILGEAIQGRGAEAVALTREHLAEYPRDAFVLSQSSGVFGLIGFSGCLDRNDKQLALLEPLAGAYGDDWWYLTALSFAHEESEHYSTARTMAERSLELYDRNGHAAHVVAHVFFETADAGNGGAFLDGWLPGLDRAATIHAHLAWHRALFHLANDDADGALDIYQREIRPGSSQAAALGIVSDGASLLWRCNLYGFERSLPWDELREFTARAFPRPGVMFGDVHCALVYAASGDTERLGSLIDGLRARAAEGKIAAGEVIPRLAEAIAAFAAGDYEGSARILLPIADHVIRIGGSHAQRELYEDTLVEALLRSGQYEEAKVWLQRRLERRPSPRDLKWLARAEAGVAA